MTEPANSNMAVFCDFENIAIGAREARYQKFDIKKVLERLLLKGTIIVKKAYCDWERYKEFKAAMHEASFELIEIPHVRQSGKNSADIRMVVDALDLCYTKPHVDTFVLISGDSDFSPLVSKLRENNKTVVGLGVKMSTSDLFISNCDEFIYYDDLVREKEKKTRSRKKPEPKTGAETAEKPHKKSAEEKVEEAPDLVREKAKKTRTRKKPEAKASADKTDKAREKSSEDKVEEALDLVLETVEALFAERGEQEKIWGSMVKQALKRRRPGFNELYYGFNSFSRLLDEAAARGLLKMVPDEKSGGTIITSFNPDY
ncbi:MAG TPA: NYN domain-containing protein [Burkholderiales bacterium]